MLISVRLSRRRDIVVASVPKYVSSKAERAFNDYLEMGEGRSLPKLAARYKTSIQPVPARQLSRLLLWSAKYGWQQRLADIAVEQQKSIAARGIADKQNRIDAYNDRWRELQEAKRAWADEYKNAPGGGKTGYYARQVKVVKVHGEYDVDEKTGKSYFVATGKSEEVEEWALDTGLLKELRELEKQAAVEVGDWTEKHVNENKDEVLHGVDDASAQRLADLIAAGITAVNQASSRTGTAGLDTEVPDDPGRAVPDNPATGGDIQG